MRKARIIMIARTEASDAARTSAADAAGVFCSMALETLASTAGHRPSIADSHSGRWTGVAGRVQLGSAPAAWIAGAASCRLSK